MSIKLPSVHREQNPTEEDPGFTQILAIFKKNEKNEKKTSL
jgi:hypothetical protein